MNAPSDAEARDGRILARPRRLRDRRGLYAVPNPVRSFHVLLDVPDIAVASAFYARLFGSDAREIVIGRRYFHSGSLLLGLIDLSVWYVILNAVYSNLDKVARLAHITSTMIAFGIGASSQALFARVGGGIFTTAADVGADLVG